jgi:chemotaxis protein CheX
MSGVVERVAQAAVGGASDVFERMACVRPASSVFGGAHPNGPLVSGIVGLASDRLRISLAVHFPVQLAREMTARMLDQTVESLEGDGLVVQDAVGEIANMIAGRVKNRLAGEGHALAISMPSVVEGCDLALARESLGHGFGYRLAFASGDCWIQGAVVELRPERPR